MRPSCLARQLWVALALFAMPAAAFAQARFQALGFLPGGSLSEAFDVSADGSVVVGSGRSGNQPLGEAFRWTTSEGMVGLGSLSPFLRYSEARAVSADGSVIAGATRSPVSITEAFYFTQGKGMVGIGFLPGLNLSQAFDVEVSPSGEIVVVGVSRLVFKEAFRWTKATGMVGLGRGVDLGFDQSRALAVSRDGQKVAGFFGEIGSPSREAFRYSVTSSTLAPLGCLPRGSISDGNDVSANGTVLAGASGFADAGGSGMQGFLATAGNPDLHALGFLPGASSSEALAVSSDGKVVVGRSGDGATSRAFIWDPENGIRDVQVLLSAAGIATTGWQLLSATGIADDGKTLVGSGINPEGLREAFLAKLGDPLQLGDARPVATGRDFSCVIAAAGAVNCWGNFPASPNLGGPALQISAGEMHLCAVLSDGSIGCAGSGGGELSPPPGAFKRVAAGGGFTCALAASDGAITCFGAVPDDGPLPGGAFVDIDAGREHFCAVRESGTVVCYGYDSLGTGKLSLPPDLSAVVQVAAGDEHSCALQQDGRVRCWGLGANGQGDLQATPPGGTFSFVATGSFHTCGIRTPIAGATPADVVECWGRGKRGPPADDGQSRPPPDIHFTALDAGGMGSQTGHSCGVNEEGDVFCWGQSQPFGQACPPGDLECDGIPDRVDNCPGPDPENANFDQADADGDRIGDSCDLCPLFPNEGVDPLEQPDGDADGFGDSCDACEGVQNVTNEPSECAPAILKLVPAAPSGLVAVSSFAAPLLSTSDFNLLIDCGNEPSVAKIGLAILLGPAVDPSTINFGNQCDRPENGGCPDADPNNRLTDEADTMSPDTFVRLPGDPALPPGADPQALYFSIRARSTSPGLCVAGETDKFLAKITIGDLSPGETPPFTTTGAQQTVGNLAEDAGGEEVDPDRLQLQSGSPSPKVVIVLEPDIVLNPNLRLFTVKLGAEFQISRVLFGLRGVGAQEMKGCLMSDPNPCGNNPPTLAARDCTNSSGFGPPQWFGSATVDYGNPSNPSNPKTNTFVFQPGSADAVAGLDGVESDTLYVSVEAKVNQTTGTFRALNPIPIVNGQLNFYKLGTVGFVPQNAQQGIVAPSVVFGGTATLFAMDRKTCTLNTAFQPFQPTSPVNNLNANNFATQQVFAFGQDPDGDLVANDFENCRFRANSDQSDNGRVASLDNPSGAGTNGHGDVCECGNVVGNEGRVLADDAAAVLQRLTGTQPTGFSLDRSNVVGPNPSDVGPEDWVAIKQAQTTAGGEVGQNCAAAFR